MKRKNYETPTTMVVALEQQTALMQFSRSCYDSGGDGFGSGIGGRLNFDDGGDGFGDSGLGGRSGYGNGGSGFGDSGIGGRSGYGDGGDGFF